MSINGELNEVFQNGEENIEQKLKLFIEIITHDDKIDEMLSKGYIPYVYNGCYGGPGGSKEYFSLFYLLSYLYEEHFDQVKSIVEISDKLIRLNGLSEYDIERYFNAKVIVYLGERVKTQGSKPVFDFVKLEYVDCIKVNEYDGFESIEINTDRFCYNSTKKVLDFVHNGEIDSETAITMIDTIYKNILSDVIIYHEEVYQE